MLVPDADALPQILPVFPLTGVLLLPRGRLPLNIFEPRYLAMIGDARLQDQMIGMIQPLDPRCPDRDPETYRTGCAGIITRFEEAGDGRFLITLTGISRFRLVEELPLHRGYRRVVPDWTPFRHDFLEEGDEGVDRHRLLGALQAFFRMHGISADWNAIVETPNERLVTSLAMICPFEPSEKQALLEAATLEERARVMTALIEMAVLDQAREGETARH